ncbi:single-stranded DNA-binding protein [Streptomyces inhibens]|uniref:Single-stranded DNA-binding protein n=1 Tax=Streptomyces inhibens TaxID=2293571 RepID=A0A371Q6A0_STRIH|nr:single-stranded DNA-binding protein [Streptomyces inhibens]
MVTLVGNAATAVEHRQTTAGVTVARFRLAATSRRWDKAQERWTDGETSFYTVRSWRGLADNVAASVAVGEPLVVQGRLRLREGEQPAERGGQRWFSAEVDAVAIGHDLSRGTAAFRRVTRAARTGVDPVPSQPSAQPQPQSQSQSQSLPRPHAQPVQSSPMSPSPQREAQEKALAATGTPPATDTPMTARTRTSAHTPIPTPPTPKASTAPEPATPHAPLEPPEPSIVAASPRAISPNKALVP